MRLKRQTKTTALTIERNFSKLHLGTKPSNIAQFINPKFSALAAFLPLATNAALSSEQRRPPNLNHCAVNIKFKAN
ncbi:hypothetical protein [Vibrio sp. E14]|uniref:hypothetical protein n=1 Tax=Vibrio sp. E14 TaxID=2849869 RepID=UPI001CF82B7E|nr:hypothetical protein [Vibrio sp. E14]